MNQGNVVFGALFLGFMIYITMKGELSTYMGFFIPSSSSTNPPASAQAQRTQAIGGAMVAASSQGPLASVWSGLKAPGSIFGLPFLP